MAKNTIPDFIMTKYVTLWPNKMAALQGTETFNNTI